MVQSKAATVQEYLAELDPERRKVIETVRKVILKNLPKGYKEVMQYGMIGYVIPLETYPDTYNGQALGYVALASQKNYMSLYLMNVYGDKKAEKEFEQAFAAAGKKLDMGKSCVRFKQVEDLPLDVIGKTIARTSPKQFIVMYEASRKK
ncbi:MAG: DUF1801 domain-containing protein [Candidatus Andersenbacteria bacterium]